MVNMKNKSMKYKIIALKILVILLTILLLVVQLLAAALILLYLKENYYILGLIFFWIVAPIFTVGIETNYDEFEEQEVEKWEKLTFKRTIKFMFKYYLHVFDELVWYFVGDFL